MSRLRRALRLVARAAALGVTAALLVATSNPGTYCEEWTVPVAFRPEGSCGPGGVIVVEANENGYLTITNPEVLGLPPVPSSGVDARYTRTDCPFALAQGSWSVSIEQCVSGAPSDAGTTDGGPTDDAGAGSPTPSDANPGCITIERHCQANLAPSGELWFTCGAYDAGASACESRLTPIP